MDFIKKRKLLDELYDVSRKCRLCALSETRQNVLCGAGNLDAKLFLVALSPGEMEDKENKLFIGPSGKVLNRLLENAEVNRDDLYISNLVKCNLPQNRKPKMRDIETCHQYLDKELEIVSPEFIIPLGFYASRYVLEKYNADIPSAKADFRELYGKLFYASAQKILPLPHPASLLYNPDFEEKTQTKYNILSILGTECKWYYCCPMKRFYHTGKIKCKWIELYCHGNWKYCKRYQMEEKGEYHSDSMLPDGTYFKQI